MMNIELLYKLSRYTKEGELVEETEELVSESLVLQFLEILTAQAAYKTMYVTCLDGTELQWSVNVNGEFRMNAQEGFIENRGVIVGTGNAVVTNVDYNLETKVAHGTGAGQMVHGHQDFLDAVVNGDNVDLTLYRTFTNNSGGTIVLREIGIAVGRGSSDLVTQTALIARDVLGSEYTVLDTEVVVAQYIFRTTA